MLRNPEYLDDGYSARLEEWVEGTEDVSFEEAESVYLSHCESLHEGLNDGTPLGVIRRAAFSNTKSHFRYG